MSATIQWDNDEKTIILYQEFGEVTVDDYLYAINRIYHMMTSVSHPVHLIYDRSQVRAVPSSLSRVFQYASKYVPANVGMRVIVGGSPATQVALQLARVISRHLVTNLHFAETLSDARALIYTQTGSDARI